MASPTFTDQLSDSAQHQLAALREALESRLATLEEVLADPSRGESLAGLILDLSRIATEEAQAAAAQACLSTRADADKEITELRTSAKAALEAAQAALRSAHASLQQEQTIGEDLRREVEQARLQLQKQGDLLAAREQLEASLKGDREQLEAEIARQKTAAAGLQRTSADAQQHLEKERTSARKAHDEIAAQLAQERDALAGRERALAELRSELDAERASAAEMRGTIERAETRVSTLEREQAAAQTAHAAVVADLAREREAAPARERAYAQLHAQLQAERASAAALQSQLEAARGSVTEVHAQLDAQRASAAELNAQLEAERASAAELRQTAERAAELEATLGRETSEGKTAQQKLSAELANHRKASALLQKALADGQQALAAARADLQVERTSNADLRQAVDYADQQLASARSNETQALAHLEQVSAERDRLRAERASATTAAGAIGDVQRELAMARTDADTLRAETEHLRADALGLRAELDSARTRLDALTAERDTVAGELQAARQWIDELREAEAEFAMLSPAPSQPATAPVPSPPTSAKPSAKAKTTGGEDDGWQAVRLATRYVFSEEIAVQINGDPGRLFDLSICGCQLLSPKALKPNHTVKVTLPSEKKPVVCTGTVVWTRLEPPAAGRAQRYRAGVRFTKADELAIEAFASQHGATT